MTASYPVQCDAGTGHGVVCFDSNAWGFSCIPALGTAGQTWDIAFIGGNAFGSETQVLVGVPVGADYTNTPAQATFRALTVSLMIDTTVTGRDTIESGSIIKPRITAKWAVSSFFFHTKVNATVDIEEIAGK